MHGEPRFSAPLLLTDQSSVTGILPLAAYVLVTPVNARRQEKS
jgi:hypothetical protein